MKLYFSVKEFCIEDNLQISLSEAQCLFDYIFELSVCREILGKPIRVSQRSGLRTKAYELSKKRSGNSQHATYDIGQGAVDLIYYKELFDLLIERKFFTRICYYPNNGFIHCDRKPTGKSKVEYYECSSPTAQWVFKCDK
jgi:hypothetical protein